MFVIAFDGTKVHKVKTLLDTDIRKVLERVGEKYGVKLPRRVVTVDYGDDVGDLFVRFRHVIMLMVNRLRMEE
jgi:hypothetical protein